MQRSFKLIVTILISFTATMGLMAQEVVTFKDVLLDGKPAKLNVATGEITLAKLKEQIIETKVDSVITKPITATKPQTIAGHDQSVVSTEGTSDFYIVQDGDNLFKISVNYNTSLAILKKANNLESTLIRKGQKLRVRNFDKVDNKLSVWIVKKGDNLYRIAMHTGTTVSAIKRINGLTSDTIYIGQQLQLK
jgi:LysM repeat protein